MNSMSHNLSGWTTEQLLDRCKAAVVEVLEATKVVAEGMERVCS